MNNEQRKIWETLKYGPETEFERLQRLMKYFDTPEFKEWQRQAYEIACKELEKHARRDV